MLTDEQAPWAFALLVLIVAILAVLRGGWWGLLQVAVFLAVVCGNIYWHWTPNGYVASAMGVGAALVTTLAVNWLLSLRQGRHRFGANE